MTWVRRVAVSGLTLTAGAAAVLLLAPDGWDDPAATVVTEGRSARAYQQIVTAGADAPGWLSGLGEHLPAVGLAVLALLLAWTGWTGWRRRTATGAGSLLILLGTVLAYLVSEATKLLLDQERPCRAFSHLTTWEQCPPAGDWSFPSNHATVAGAMAAGMVLLVPRLAMVAVPAAGAVAAMRVVAGVHYPHDVVAGLLLGTTVTAALLVALLPRRIDVERGELPEKSDGPASPPRRPGGRYWV